MQVKVWTHEECEVCEVIVVGLQRAGVPFVREYVVHTAELTARLRQLGITQMPVVEAEEVLWSGDQPELVEALGRIVRRGPTSGR